MAATAPPVTPSPFPPGSTVKILYGSNKHATATVTSSRQGSSGLILYITIPSQSNTQTKIYSDEVSLISLPQSSSSIIPSPHHDPPPIEAYAPPTTPWLLPSIRTRIISKSFMGGKYYKSKTVIVDVTRVGEATVRIEDSGAIVHGTSPNSSLTQQ